MNNLATIMISHFSPLARFLYQRKLSPEEAQNIFSTFIKYQPEHHQLLLPMRHCIFNPHLRHLIFTHWSQYAPSEIYLSQKLIWGKGELDLVASRLVDNPQLIGSEKTKRIVFGSNDPFIVHRNVSEIEIISSFYSSSQSLLQHMLHRNGLLYKGIHRLSVFERNMLAILKESNWIAKIQANILKIVEIFSELPNLESHWHSLIILTVLNLAEMKEQDNSLTREDRRNMASLILNYLQDTLVENMCLSQIRDMLKCGAELGLRLKISSKGQFRCKLNHLKSLYPGIPSIWGKVSDYIMSWKHFLYSNVSNIQRLPTVIINGRHLVKWWAAYSSKSIDESIHLSPLLPYPVYFAKLEKYHRKLSSFLRISHSLLIKHGHLFKFDEQSRYYEWNSVDSNKMTAYFREGRAFSRFILTYLAYYGCFPSDLSPAVISNLLIVKRRGDIISNDNTSNDILEDIRGFLRNGRLYTFIPASIRSQMAKSHGKHK